MVVKNKKRWIIRNESWFSGPPLSYLNRTQFMLLELELDKKLKFFVPSLFTEIKVMPDKVVVEVPLQTAQKVADHLYSSYIDVPLEVIGV